MVAQHARYVRRMRARRRLTIPLAALTIVVTMVCLARFGWSWWVLPGGFGALCALGIANFANHGEGERGRPDTTVEVTCVVGVEILDWGTTDAAGQHGVRVIGRPLGYPRPNRRSPPQPFQRRMHHRAPDTLSTRHTGSLRSWARPGRGWWAHERPRPVGFSVLAARKAARRRMSGANSLALA